MFLYLSLNFFSVIVPFIYSFHPRIKFNRLFNVFIPALIISALVYLSWDVLFTIKGVWGFNDDYLVGLRFLSLPIEEWLFFFCIPYACVFTHFTLTKLYPDIGLSDFASRIITVTIASLLLVFSALNIEKAYTSFNGFLSLIILLITVFKAPKILNTFYLTFLVILVPFFLVNGTLTGSFIKDEVVWYNNAENLGIRLFTIPVEDIFYAFGLLLLNVLLTEIFLNYKSEANKKKDLKLKRMKVHS